LNDQASITALLQQAVALHQQGRFDAALVLYQQVLAAEPRQFDALHLSGVIARQQGDAQQAVDLIGQALAIAPERANAHCNLGAALQDLGRSEAALASYERALALDPAYALAHANRGNSLRKLGRLVEALASYDTALRLRPGYPEVACHRAIALHDLGRDADALASAELALRTRPAYPEALAARGNALHGLGRFRAAAADFEAALQLTQGVGRAELLCWLGGAQIKLQRLQNALNSFDAALALRPRHAHTLQLRANALRLLGRCDDSATAYREALALGGDSIQIGFALAALGAAPVPAQAPADYVKALFDQYADHFDAHLVQDLDYRTPALIGRMLAGAVLMAGADAADLGCGTGLCGPVLRPLSRRLSGVDLSPKMLARAAERQLYDALDCADIAAWLAVHPGSFDLLVAADVLVYIGALDQLFAQARAAARPGAAFCFSVERDDGVENGYALAAAGRYVHSRAYLETVAQQAGWGIEQAADVTLREDGGRPVAGMLLLFRAD
jgi:predicted TPR repeat methyltransferase